MDVLPSPAVSAGVSQHTSTSSSPHLRTQSLEFSLSESMKPKVTWQRLQRTTDLQVLPSLPKVQYTPISLVHQDATGCDDCRLGVDASRRLGSEPARCCRTNVSPVFHVKLSTIQGPSIHGCKRRRSWIVRNRLNVLASSGRSFATETTRTARG